MKKIFYVPGLISALLIPILFWYYGSQRVHPQYTIMDLGLPAKHKYNDTFDNTFEPYRNWNYKKIKVVSNKAKENSKSYVSEIKTLQKKNQKETGIEFILDKNNSYGDFVSLLNDMAIAKHDTYGLDLEKTGHLFATVNYKNPNAKEEKFECLLCYDVIYTYKEPILKDNFSDFLNGQYYQILFENISKLPKSVLFIIFGFLLFLNISMLSIRERFQM